MLKASDIDPFVLQEDFLPEQAWAVPSEGSFGNDTVARNDYGERIVLAHLPYEPGEPRVSDAGRYLAIGCRMTEGDTGYGVKDSLVKVLGRDGLSCTFPEGLCTPERKRTGKTLGRMGKIAVQGRKEPVELALMGNAVDDFPAHLVNRIAIS